MAAARAEAREPEPAVTGAAAGGATDGQCLRTGMFRRLTSMRPSGDS